jgi:hypothetical protein
VQHSEYNKIVKEEICKFIKEKGITKDNKMTDEQMKEFVDRISSGKGSSRSNSRKLLAFNSAVMKQVIKPIPTDDASVMRRGQALVRNSSRYVAIAAVASITTFLTDSAKALDVMAESNHFKGAIRQAQQGNLAGTQQEIMGDSAEDLDGQDLFGDLVRGGVDRRFAYRIKIEVDKYFAQIAQKRNAIDALRD